jgi:hypothetical protein
MITLDPRRLEAVLSELDPSEAWVFCWVLALSPNGELEVSERVLAHRTGLSLAELRAIIDQLAGQRIKDRPLLGRAQVKGVPRIRVEGPPGFVIHHGRSAPPPGRDAPTTPRDVPGAPAPSARTRKKVEIDYPALLDSRAAQLAAESPELAERTAAWLAHLATFEPDGALPIGVQVRQYETVFTLCETFGPEATGAGILLACRLAETRLSTPEAYLVRVVKSAVERASRQEAMGRGHRQGTTPVPAAEAEAGAIDLDSYDIDPLAEII